MTENNTALKYTGRRVAADDIVGRRHRRFRTMRLGGLLLFLRRGLGSRGRALGRGLLLAGA